MSTVRRQRVWKFVLSPNLSTFVMPVGAQILAVGAQGDEVVLWALVDPSADREERQFVSIPTGVPAYLDGTEYRGTAKALALVTAKDADRDFDQ